MDNDSFGPRRAIAAALVAALAVVGSWFGVQSDRAPGEPVRSSAATTYVPSKVYETPATQDIAYQIGDRPAQDLDGAIEYARTNLARPLHRGEGYRIRRTGSDTGWSAVRPLNDTIKRLYVRLDDAKVGDKWVVMSVESRFHMWTLKVDTNPAAVIDTVGTPAVDIIVGTVVAKFGDVPEWGIISCRRIDGSSSWSQHAYANAVDFGGDTNRLNAVVNYIVPLVRAGYVPASQVLWRGRNVLSGGLVDDHYNHIHFSGDPLRYGSPTAC